MPFICSQENLVTVSICYQKLFLEYSKIVLNQQVLTSKHCKTYTAYLQCYSNWLHIGPKSVPPTSETLSRKKEYKFVIWYWWSSGRKVLVCPAHLDPKKLWELCQLVGFSFFSEQIPANVRSVEVSHENWDAVAFTHFQIIFLLTGPLFLAFCYF